MVMKVKEVIELLEANGWQYVRTRGDHHVFKKEGESNIIVVPGNLNKDLKKGTLYSILRQIGL